MVTRPLMERLTRYLPYKFLVGQIRQVYSVANSSSLLQHLEKDSCVARRHNNKDMDPTN